MTISFDVPSLYSLREGFLIACVMSIRSFLCGRTLLNMLLRNIMQPPINSVLMCLCLGLSNPSHAFSIGRDGSFSYDESEIQPLLDQLMSGEDGSHLWGQSIGDIVIAVLPETNGGWGPDCRYLIHGTPMTREDAKKNNYEYVRGLIAAQSNVPMHGGPMCHQHAGHQLRYLWIAIYTSDRASWGKYAQLFNQFDINSFPSEPNVCKASLESPMAFGLVNPSSVGPHSALTRINVSCTQSTVISVKVNDGNPFLDPVSGTKISLTPRAEYLRDSVMVCEGDCSVRVIGEMNSVPASPGAYSWGVPVIVEYK